MKAVSIPTSARAPVIALCYVMSSALIHFAVMRPTALIEWLALTSLVAVPLIIGLAALRWRVWLLFLALAAGFWWLVRVGGGRPLLYLPSILIPAGLAWFFGRTLFSGRQPLIATVALAARASTPDYLLAYSRRLTQLWTLVFIAMATGCAALALFAPHGWWSFMANAGNYIIIGATVVLEYIYRRLRFRDYPHPGFKEYLGIVMRADPRRIKTP